MIASAPLIVALLLALTISVVWVANSPIDDPYSILNNGWNGTSGLAERGFVVMNEDLTGKLLSRNATGVMFLGPSRRFTSIEAASIGSFVRTGGLLVIVDNFGSGNSLLETLGLPVRFDGRLLVDPLFYQKQPLFPVISDLTPSEFSNGVRSLLLNYPTALNVTTGEAVTVLARSSPFSFLDLNRNGQKNPDEPSGAFPVLAELSLGEGTVVLFTSPASFANGLIDEANNDALIQNIAKRASQQERYSEFLLDQTHLQSSGFTSVKLMARQLTISVVEGGMQLSAKLGLAAIAIVVLAARYVYKRPPRKDALEKTERSRIVQSMDAESVLRLHPTWDRKTLEYVANEVEASMNWRRSSEKE
jgi:hypothetical protein